MHDPLPDSTQYLIHQPLNAVYGRILQHLTVVFRTVDRHLGRELKSSRRRYGNRMTAPSNRQVRLQCAALLAAHTKSNIVQTPGCRGNKATLAA